MGKDNIKEYVKVNVPDPKSYEFGSLTIYDNIFSLQLI